MRCKIHLKNEKQTELMIPDWVFKETIENFTKNIYNPKLLKQLGKEKIKLDDKQKAKR